MKKERCEKLAKLFTTLLFITLSFIMLDVFHIYIKADLCNTMLGTCKYKDILVFIRNINFWPNSVLSDNVIIQTNKSLFIEINVLCNLHNITKHNLLQAPSDDNNNPLFSVILFFDHSINPILLPHKMFETMLWRNGRRVVDNYFSRYRYWVYKYSMPPWRT